MARWKAEIYPQLRTEAAQVGAMIYFVDEAGVRSDYHAGTTQAPVGRTPVVATTGDRFVTGPDDLKAEALAALYRLQRLPHLVRSFFRDPNLRYITA